MPLPLIPAAALSLLSAIAPNLIQAAGTVVEGAARKYLLEPLGLAPEADEKSIERAISNASPETLARIKEADLKFQAEMEKLGVDLEALHQKDRESARAREKEVGGWVNPVLAAVVVGGFFGTVLYVLSGKADMVAGGQLVGALIGYVSAKADQVVSYYFGSSAGSAAKTKLMANGAGRR